MSLDTVYINIKRECVLNFFENRSNKINIYRDYPVYGGYIESYQRGKGIGMKMWEYCEADFFNSQDTSYLRFVFDADVENKWTTRHVSELIKELNKRGISVTKLAEKSWQKKFMGILLFQK